MTSIRPLYRDLSSDVPDALANSAEEEEAIDANEEERLQVFENGYSAGWEDAINAQKQGQAAALDDFMASLQDVSFGFHEARAGLVKAMQPVLNDIIAKVLPEVVHTTLGLHVVEQLTDMLRGAAEQDIRIEATEANLDHLEATVGDDLKSPFVCVVNDTLSPNQVILRVSEEERELDFEGLIAGIADAVRTFTKQIQKDKT